MQQKLVNFNLYYDNFPFDYKKKSRYNKWKMFFIRPKSIHLKRDRDKNGDVIDW